MKIKTKDFEKTVKKVEILEQRLFAHPLSKERAVDDLMALCSRKEQVWSTFHIRDLFFCEIFVFKLISFFLFY